MRKAYNVVVIQDGRRVTHTQVDEAGVRDAEQNGGFGRHRFEVVSVTEVPAVTLEQVTMNGLFGVE